MNTSAIASDTIINLNDGQISTIDGKSVTIASGTVIERALTGDGNDILTGNAANNLLFGGRGTDRFIIRHGDTGTTTVEDFNVSEDLITFANYSDLSDIADLTLSANGSDTHIILPDGQLVIVKSTSPSLLTNNHFQFNQNFALHSIVLNVYEQTLTDGDDYFYHPQTPSGNPVDDTTPQRIYGRGGNDTIFGNLGDDELYGEDGNDTLVGFHSSSNVAGGKDKLFGGNGNDTLFGSGDKDQLFGGKDDDVLRENLGDDELYGGEGYDTLIGDEGNDIIHLERGLNDVWGDNYNNDPALWDGSLGADTFVVHKWEQPVSGSINNTFGFVKDLIRDFDPVHDVLDIKELQDITHFSDLVMTTLILNGVEYPDLKIRRSPETFC